jgi:hypothetical protein
MSDEQAAPGRRPAPLQVLGVLVALGALVLVLAPTLAHDPGPAPDLFEAIERRVRWGLGVGVGALLVARPWRRPWSVVFAWVLLCGSGGYLIARLIGIALEGPGSGMQWVWTGVEVVLCALTAAWIRYRRDAPDRP